jgi:hypothetical protein
MDLGVTDQLAWMHLPAPLASTHLTRPSAATRALAQRAHKTKRVKAIHAKIANCRKDWTHKGDECHSPESSVDCCRQCLQSEAGSNEVYQVDLSCGLGYDADVLAIQSPQAWGDLPRRSCMVLQFDLRGLSPQDGTAWTKVNWG